MAFIGLARHPQHISVQTAINIEEKQLERYRRYRRVGDPAIIADMYYVSEQKVRNAINLGKGDQEILNALLQFYGPQK